MLPLARTDRLRVEQLSNELVIYDFDRHKAHCLGPVAALVWRACDGRNTAKKISSSLKKQGLLVDEEMTWMVLHRFGKLHLLHQQVALPKNAVSSSRRELLRKALAAGGVCLLLTTTICAPTSARARSDSPSGDKGRDAGHGHHRHGHEGRGHGNGHRKDRD
jgi:Coenzyme PQQ synthesis protein D (PqqD)